jgi:broad specificity phosphatase PhoE
VIRIFIARHGETDWNAEGRIQGQSDPDLSPKGCEQRLLLLERLKEEKLSAIYTSTLRRAVNTAEPLARHLGLPLHQRPELNEIAFGILEGAHLSDLTGELRAEWERFRDNRLTYRIPGAENYADVADRLRPFKEEILGRHEGEEILVVAHRGVNRMFIGLLLEYPLEASVRIEQTNETLYLVERNGATRSRYFLDGEVREGVLAESPRLAI